MSSAGVRTFVVLSDLQIPWQDQEVIDGLVIPFIKTIKPYGVILNGDIADCYIISDFHKNPENVDWTLQKEIDESGKLMQALKHIKEKWWLAGNHEDRWRRAQWRNGALKGMLKDFPEAFKLDQYGFKWKRYGEHVDLGRLMVTHGNVVSRHSAWSGKAHFDSLGSSVLIGHTHRLGIYYKTDLRGMHAAYENGCLCKLDPEYVQHPNWQQGFSVVKVFDDGMFHVQQVPVLNRRVLLYGDRQFTR